MWLIHILPDTVIHSILILGILGVIVSIALNVIPFISQYRAGIQAISTVLILVGAWLEGGNSIDREYKIKELETKVQIANLEKQIQVSERHAAEASGKIEIVYRDKVKVVKDTQVIVKEKIKNVAVNIDSECTIKPEVIDILNTSARNKVGKK